MRGACSALLLLAATAASAERCDRQHDVIALDPGHTTAQPGAISARGVPEVRFNRELAKRTAEALKAAGFDRVFITSDLRDDLGLAERAALAARRGARLLLSLHHDSVQPRYLSSWSVNGSTQWYSDRYSGYSLFVSERNRNAQDSLELAGQIGSELRRRCLVPTRHHAEAVPGEGRELIDAARGIYRYDELVVLQEAPMPAVLFEAGLIVNRADELVLQSPERQRLVAQALTTAIVRYCGHEALPQDAPICDGDPGGPPVSR
ncbi:MAG: N-acetylmuramoyl-L-alanine amidase [Proteobacteria bacterium]|nr:N-acetylmuramoyl-L-alanine amidase [Pseudomonadota bacterium]